MNNTLTPRDLTTLPLFEGELPQALAWLLESAEESWYHAGDILLQPGEGNDRLAVILDGEVRVEIEAGGKVAISRLSRGDCVGELSVLDGKPVTAYVIADSPCRLLLLRREDVWRLIDSSHAVARNMLHILSTRIRNDNTNLSASIQRQRQYERSARTDVLTGLNNRRWLEEMLPRLMERCRRDASPLAMLMLDVDYFKRYNDEQGHLAGDQALRSLGKVLLANMRPNDVAVRYGGEEFMVILPATDAEVMVAVAQRICEMVRECKIEDEAGEPLPSITVSIGAALWRGADPLEAVIAAADAALYQAKEAGRNRVVVSRG